MPTSEQSWVKFLYVGIIGWIWIAASLVAVYFLVRAVFLVMHGGESSRALLRHIAVSGGILIIIGNSIGSFDGFWKWLPPTLDGIGIAVVSAAILAGTIENWLLSDLAKNVFLTTIGQHLPVEYGNALKAELLRLASYKFFCERQVLRFKFEPISGSDHLRLTTILEKLLEIYRLNPSNSVGSYISMIGVWMKGLW